MRQILVVLGIFTATLVGACSTSPEKTASAPATAVPAGPGDTRKYLLETVDDAAIVQYYADGFDKLPLREKTLVFHLYQAALAGRDIFIDQKHRNALEMRGVFEAILTHAQGIDAATLQEIQRYA
jgi:dipeptidyl-peptidase-3